jgi:hypothetical protein
MKKYFVLLLLFFSHQCSFGSEKNYCINRISIPQHVYRSCIASLQSSLNNNYDYTLERVIDPVLIGREILPEDLHRMRIEFNLDLYDEQHREVIKYFYENYKINIGDDIEISFYEYKKLKFCMKKIVDRLDIINDVIFPLIEGGKIPLLMYQLFKEEYEIDLSDQVVCAMIKHYFLS